MAKKQKLERHPQQIQPEELSDEVKEFLQGETDELPESAEEISNEEAAELEKQVKNADKCLYFNGKKINRECKKDDCKCYLLSSLDCDDFTEVSEEEKERVNSEEDAADPNDTSSNEEEKEEVKAEPVEEQKKYANKKAALEEEIKQLEASNTDLEKKAEIIEDTVETFCMESIQGMENFIKEAIKSYTDQNDIKEIKNEIKNLETVFAFESLLRDYKTLASEHRATITANENDIKNDKEQIKELAEKINCFQTKLEIKDNAETRTESDTVHN